jgi:TRAP-type C4-dicarboxylate transport system permease large subunit
VVELVTDPDRMGFAPEFALAEWDVEAIDSRVENVLRVRDDIPFSNINYEIRIQRQSGYYLWKIFLTVIIIVSLTWVVFWMSDERLGRRAGISSSGILTVIAYQFVTSATLPRVSYLTVADRVMTVSIITIAATMVVSIIVDRVDFENQAAKLRIDRACRWIFPVAYLSMLGIIIGRNGVF